MVGSPALKKNPSSPELYSRNIASNGCSGLQMQKQNHTEVVS